MPSDLRVGSITVGIEAAHIKWHQARGPDQVNNGYAPCELHHKLIDYGAFTVAPNHRLQASEPVNGGSAMVDQVLMRYHGQELALPRRAEHLPQADF